MSRNKNLFFHGVIVCGLLFMGGCTNLPPSHLIFHQDLVFGADISTASMTGTAPDRLNITLGYDRQTNAVIPKIRICKRNNAVVPCSAHISGATLPSEEFEAMSVLSKSYIGMNWFGTDKISERLATGDAAAEMAKSPDLIEALAAEK